MKLLLITNKAKLAKKGVLNIDVFDVNEPFVKSTLNQLDFTIQHAEHG